MVDLKNNDDVVARAKAVLMPRVERLHLFITERIPPEMATVVTPDDILQEVWLSIFHANKEEEVLRLARVGELDTWLTTTARRKLVDVIRNARRTGCTGRPMLQVRVRGNNSRTTFFSSVPAGQRSPSSVEAALERSVAVQIAIRSLRGPYRQAITLYHIEGRSRAEVAQIMRRSEAAVHGLLHRGLQKLRQHLGSADRFFSDEVLVKGSSAHEPKAVFGPHTSHDKPGASD